MQAEGNGAGESCGCAESAGTIAARTPAGNVGHMSGSQMQDRSLVSAEYAKSAPSVRLAMALNRLPVRSRRDKGRDRPNGGWRHHGNNRGSQQLCVIRPRARQFHFLLDTVSAVISVAIRAYRRSTPAVAQSDSGGGKVALKRRQPLISRMRTTGGRPRIEKRAGR